MSRDDNFPRNSLKQFGRADGGYFAGQVHELPERGRGLPQRRLHQEDRRHACAKDHRRRAVHHSGTGASERKGEFIFTCVCVRLCVCVDLSKPTSQHETGCPKEILHEEIPEHPRKAGHSQRQTNLGP